MRQYFVLAAVLALCNVIGFGAASAFAQTDQSASGQFWEFCDKTSIGPSCPATCNVTPCTNYGVTCNVLPPLGTHACLPFQPFGDCSNSTLCAGQCAGTSPACQCGSVAGCQ